MRKYLLLGLLLFSLPVQAKEIIVSASGFGENYDWAVLNAVENAVRQTSDIEIEGKGLQKVDQELSVSHDYKEDGKVDAEATLSHHGNASLDKKKAQIAEVASVEKKANYEVNASEKATASYKDNSKSIPAKYKGVVSSYEVLEHTEENGVHHVKIKATVIKEDVYDAHDYKSKNLIKKADYSLAVLPFKVNRPFSCLGQKLNTDELNSLISDAFVEKLAPSRKFTLVDRNHLDSYEDELSLISDNMTLPENKVKLQNLVSADYLIVGTVENFSASSSKEYVALTGETNYQSSSQLKLSYRVVETATMEIVSAGSAQTNFSKEGAFSSCSNVENLLVGRVVEKAANQLLQDIFPEYKVVQPQQNKIAVPRRTQASAPSPTNYALPLD